MLYMGYGECEGVPASLSLLGLVWWHLGLAFPPQGQPPPPPPPPRHSLASGAAWASRKEADLATTRPQLGLGFFIIPIARGLGFRVRVGIAAWAEARRGDEAGLVGLRRPVRRSERERGREAWRRRRPCGGGGLAAAAIAPKRCPGLGGAWPGLEAGREPPRRRRRRRLRGGRRRFHHTTVRTHSCGKVVSDEKYRDPFKLGRKDLKNLYEDIRKELQASTTELREMCEYYFDGKGKAFRPMIVVLMARACNFHHNSSGEVQANQRSIAVIAEMIHTASLVHDDVIDDANSRRGKMTVNQVWGERKVNFFSWVPKKMKMRDLLTTSRKPLRRRQVL
ncbi:all trans-polyprenyl-diphosphate synthase PDSS1 isoform X4 [Sceloporus undulatus]|uniref:all trans-polyprenyl-diphosphate synthase PDSS1 isoform X4 n=1 Tax=Sceloporus undulatus TaxID=8520 RepID=UPI001C4AF8FB|nr:all trans-polyprenyl-diphosphate synthase PDSS1 isoform X4 [Sceloporus undulatus]XP_042328731.1 all trans-polyprenyl-diphosphate synthase PDSS1 isoform X4 [Sceloporus undulatus]